MANMVLEKKDQLYNVFLYYNVIYINIYILCKIIWIILYILHIKC